MSKKLLFFLLTLLLCGKISGQNSDKIEKYRAAITHFSYINNDSLIFYAKKLQLADDICDKLLGISAESKGYYQQKNYNASERLSTELISLANTNATNTACIKQRKILAYNRLFWIKINQEDYNSAYSYIIHANTINESFSNKDYSYYRYKLNIETSKALIKSKLNMHQEATDILSKISQEAQNLTPGNQTDYNSLLQQRANILNSLANSYLALHEKDQNSSHIDSALVNYNRAFAISKTFEPRDEDSEIIYYLRITKVNIAKKQYQKAIDLINDYPNISKSYNYHHRQYFQKALCFYHLKNSDSTIFYANKLLHDKNEKCKPSTLITTYDLLSNTYYNLNQIDSAYKYSKLTLNEFNSAKKNKDKTYQLLYKNDFERVKSLNASIIEKEKQSKNRIVLYFVLFAIILIVIFHLLFRKEKQIIQHIAAEQEDLTTSENKVQNKKEYNIDKELEVQILKHIQEIEDNLEYLNSDFSIKLLARKLDTNTTYISFVFNKNKGESFKQYYAKLRITYLINKLKTDEKYRKYAIQSLGEEIGYTNASAFTRAFKKHVGVTPSVFIKSLEN